MPTLISPLKLRRDAFQRIGQGIGQLCLCLTLGLHAATTVAKDYQVEAIVFAQTTAHTAFESTHYQPVAEANSEATTWPLEPEMLLDEAQRIDDSADYQLLAHYAWGQEVLPSSEAAVFLLPPADFSQPLSGWIKIYASHLLFANLDLDYDGYRMTEKRRLKLNENHYFDHPRFGILLRVSRLQSATDNALDSPLDSDALGPNN